MMVDVGLITRHVGTQRPRWGAGGTSMHVASSAFRRTNHPQRFNGAFFMSIANDSEQERYQQYLCSREWNEKKEAVRKRSGGYCERCFVNPMQACHHLTYARKYNEDLRDLQAICNACHEFTHGKSNDDIRHINKAVYLAGKISNQDWRSAIVNHLPLDSHVAFPGVWKAAISAASSNGPIYLYDYSGPWFVDGEHGSTHGPNSHGRGERGSHGEQKWHIDTFERSRHGIHRCDLFIAWIDSADCFGTLVEIGMAKELGKDIHIGFADGFEPMDDFWFASVCSEGFVNGWSSAKAFVNDALCYSAFATRFRRTAQ